MKYLKGGVTKGQGSNYAALVDNFKSMCAEQTKHFDLAGSGRISAKGNQPRPLVAIYVPTVHLMGLAHHCGGLVQERRTSADGS